MFINQLSAVRAKVSGPGKFADGQGLWLIKSKSSRGKWVLRLSVAGVRREMGLGRFPDVGLAEARERAQAARRTLRDGKDPIEERQRQREALRSSRDRLTIRQAVEGCLEARKAQLKRDGLAGRWISPLEVHVFPSFGRRPIEDLDQHLLREILSPIWNVKAETAEKALNRLSLALKHAAALGLSVDLQAPMKARALLGAQRRQTRHIPSMPYGDAPQFFRSLSGEEDVSARALQFLMLTLCRTSEVRLITRTEIAGDLWVLPADRTKNGREHRVPLVAEAQAVLQTSNDDGYLFRAYKGQPISDAAMAAFMKRRGLDARPHGFRATFRTWVEEQTDTPFEVKEAVLGHVVDVGVVGAYQRGDRLAKRRDLMEMWARFLHDDGDPSKVAPTPDWQ
jgi:integrase